MRPPAPTPFKTLSRRAFLRDLAAFSLLGAVGPLAGCASLENMNEWTFGGDGLGALAQEHHRHYGAAVQSGQLEDSAFADVLAREAALLVPERELKWDVLRPSPSTFDFSG